MHSDDGAKALGTCQRAFLVANRSAWHNRSSAILQSQDFSQMGHESVVVKVAENGRLSIPARQRKLIGLDDGGLVVARVEDGEIRLRPVKAVLAAIQAEVRQHLAGSGETVDRFLADRREEAARERR
jgi:AbrB family looped-hinge helix DNA binding protein